MDIGQPLVTGNHWGILLRISEKCTNQTDIMKFLQLSLVVLCSAIISACKVEDVEQCFAEILGANISDMKELFASDTQASPETLNEQQQLLCSLFKPADFYDLLTCIDKNGCGGHQSLLPEGIIGRPGAIDLTWGGVAGLVSGICEPGCEEIGTMSQNTMICAMNAQSAGGDVCSMVESMYDCFRETLGHCWHMIGMIELSMIEQEEMIEAMCPDVDLILFVSKREVKSKVHRMDGLPFTNHKSHLSALIDARKKENIMKDHKIGLIQALEKQLQELKQQD